MTGVFANILWVSHDVGRSCQLADTLLGMFGHHPGINVEPSAILVEEQEEAIKKKLVVFYHSHTSV